MTLLEQRRTVNQRQSDQRDKHVFQQCIGTYYPRVLLAILVALIALMHTARAQDTSQIPTLQLWYEAKGISHVNYLENFDVAGGGTHAIAVNRNCGETWYLGNGTVDTTNKFCWGRGGGFRIDQLDLNGDGIMDYFHDNGDVFVGISNGVPPNTKAIAKYEFPNSGKARSISDFNGDGKADILDKTEFVGQDGRPPFIGKILLGNSDLTKLRVIELPRIPDPAYRLQYVVGAWREADGTNKLVVYQQLDTGALEREEAFFLYSFRIAGDSVLYTPLDTTEFKTFKDKVTPYYRYDASLIVIDRPQQRYSLVVFPNHSDIKTQAYSISNNRLVQGANRWTTSLKSKQLQHQTGIHDQTPLWSILLREIILCKGTPSDSIVYYGKTKLSPNMAYMEDCISIGDVNNDGMTDIAITYDNHHGEQGFAIYLGKDVSTSINDEESQTGIVISTNQLTSRSGILTVTVASPQQPNEMYVSLHSLQGKLIADLGTLPITSGTVSIPLSSYGLSPGIYNLRCTVAGRVVDKGLIITE